MFGKRIKFLQDSCCEFDCLKEYIFSGELKEAKYPNPKIFIQIDYR
ncbi:MAG: hypothetical protein ACP5OB_06305 [Candidatus Ratteibacteria bacterium]